MYPTKEKILEKRPNIKEYDIQTALDWKNICLSLGSWKKASKEEKIENLKTLIIVISGNHNLSIHIELSDEYAYEAALNTIYLDKNNPSILSSLHELGHHLYGHSELKACRWSIWLFKECFPGLYKQLKWEGHMLKR